MDSESTLRSAQQPQHQVVVPFDDGQVLDGKYKIISLLGTGGMGVVFRVKHLLLNIDLALKTLDTQRLGDATSSRRFQTEAQAAFSLKHANLVKVHDFGVLDDGHPFFVMDLVQGKTLQSMIKERGRLSLAEVAAIFPQICFGLAHAHQQRVVHRDIKPANIMIVEGMPLRQEGSVKILDFGIAKIVSGDRGEMQTLTQTGEVFGSPSYMSPEQCTGESIDHRSDVYSVGCVLFEALTGTPPQVGSNALRTMMQHINDPAPSLKEAALGADFPEELESIVKKMLAKSPSDRYADIGLAAQEIFTACGGTEQVASDTTAQSAAAAKRAVVQSGKSSTVTLSYVHLGLLIIGTGAVFSLLTHFGDNLIHSEKPAAKSVAAHAPKLDDDPIPDDMTEGDSLNVGESRGALEASKGIFHKAARIVATPVSGGMQRINFPSLSLGTLLYLFDGKFATCPARDTAVLPAGSNIVLRIDAPADQYLLYNPEIFEKIDHGLLNGLEYYGVKPSDGLADLDAGVIRRQEQTLTRLFSTVTQWRSLSFLRVGNVVLTAPMLDQIDRMSLTEVHFNRVDAYPHGWQGRKIFNRVESLGIFHCNADPILNEVAHSTSVKKVLIQDAQVSIAAIGRLRTCKALKTFILGGDSVSPDLIDALASLSQLKELNFNASCLTPGQLERLLKSWKRFTSPTLSDKLVYLIRD